MQVVAHAALLLMHLMVTTLGANHVSLGFSGCAEGDLRLYLAQQLWQAALLWLSATSVQESMSVCNSLSVHLLYM